MIYDNQSSQKLINSTSNDSGGVAALAMPKLSCVTKLLAQGT